MVRSGVPSRLRRWALALLTLLGSAPGCGSGAKPEAWIGDRWWLFDPTGITPLTGLIRIGTGRDAADVAFATMFGNVRGSAPRVAFAAAEDPAAGITRPEPTALAVSTSRQ